MILTSADLSPDQKLDFDVCVIGAGPAGITLALELAPSMSVVVLEGGAEQVVSTQQELFAGKAEGTLISHEYLRRSRLRCLGGTSGHWAGWCLPFASEDFAAKSWLGEDSWPISYSQVEPYYARAASYVEVPPWSDDTVDATEVAEPLKKSEVFTAKRFHLSPPTRFASAFREQLEKQSAISVITLASAVELRLDPATQAVQQVAFRDSRGDLREVRARLFVLATGALETTRLVLASASFLPLIEETSWLGAGFTDHVETTVGIALIPRHGINWQVSTLPNPATEDRRAFSMYFANTEELRKKNCSRFSLQLTPMPLEACPQDIIEYARVREDVYKLPMDSIHMRIRTEPRIRKSNRVRLLTERDALKMQRIALSWFLSDDELHDIRQSAQIAADELVTKHRAAVRLLLPESNPWQHSQVASHHVGTMRMGQSPTDSVVDGNLQMHGVKNLFVASSAVFKSAGVANPTLTLLALTIRLAEYLKQFEREGGVKEL